MQGLSETAAPLSVYNMKIRKGNTWQKERQVYFSASPAATNRQNGWDSAQAARNGIHL